MSLTSIILKRITDILGSSLGIILVSPLLVFLYCLIRLKLGSPVLFKQNRPGHKGKIFTFYKLRTMTDKCDSNGSLLPDKDRIVPLGYFLRKTSLDELPSLYNVLKGDMSLVGPRPLLVEYLDLYSPKQARRHDVKPGITGWAQVNGRNAITWGKKFELDLWYVNNHSLMVDLKIIMITIYKVIRRDGISQSDHVSMEKFRGNN